MRRGTYLLSCLLIVFTLAGCGHNYCVAGVGQCKEMFEEHSKTTKPTTENQLGQPDGPLFATAQPTTVPINDRRIIKIIGGVKPYECRKTIGEQGGSRMLPSDDTACEFTAGTKIEDVIVTVTDKAGAKADVRIGVGR